MTFPAENDAKAALESLQQLQATESMKLRRAAVIVRSGTGELDISETQDVSPTKKGLIIGLTALAGFVVGLLWRGLRFGAILGFTAGQTGAIVASVIDLGYGDMYLKELATDVQSGQSELVATVAAPSSRVSDLLLAQFLGATLVDAAPINRAGLPVARQNAQPGMETSASAR
jgi:uncharacterized membrane protein